MSEWISVKDRLPSLQAPDEKGISRPSDDVLIVLDDEFNSMYVGYYTKSGIWNVQETGCGCCSGDVCPTHWMPLPEPPK